MSCEKSFGKTFRDQDLFVVNQDDDDDDEDDARHVFRVGLVSIERRSDKN